MSAHHDRSLARWDMIDAAGSIVSPGVSFAVHTKEQKLLYITGFFDNMENILR